MEFKLACGWVWVLGVKGLGEFGLRFWGLGFGLGVWGDLFRAYGRARA